MWVSLFVSEWFALRHEKQLSVLVNMFMWHLFLRVYIYYKHVYVILVWVCLEIQPRAKLPTFNLKHNHTLHSADHHQSWPQTCHLPLAPDQTFPWCQCQCTPLTQASCRLRKTHTSTKFLFQLLGGCTLDTWPQQQQHPRSRYSTSLVPHKTKPAVNKVLVTPLRVRPFLNMRFRRRVFSFLWDWGWQWDWEKGG